MYSGKNSAVKHKRVSIWSLEISVMTHVSIFLVLIVEVTVRCLRERHQLECQQNSNGFKRIQKCFPLATMWLLYIMSCDRQWK